jgi:DNA-binding winged helix-turn-helix (wHTH) protein
VALRDVGHKILLINQDSTSLVKPVLELENQKYQLSFQESVSIHPDSLVNIIKSSFQKSDLPKYYLTEVTQCKDGEVAYSYEMKEDVDKDIVPCGGRELHKDCYIVSVRFTQSINSKNSSLNYLFYMLIAAILALSFLLYNYRKKNSVKNNNEDYASIGSFQFYPEQNKLVKQAEEISLSKKECELLAIFASQPNQIVKREDLMKQVWEDNGVIVGRSLDTYISKLRKKLQTDKSIKLTNVHGVGYKLEVS